MTPVLNFDEGASTPGTHVKLFINDHVEQGKGSIQQDGPSLIVYNPARGEHIGNSGKLRVLVHYHSAFVRLLIGSRDTVCRLMSNDCMNHKCLQDALDMFVKVVLTTSYIDIGLKKNSACKAGAS